MFITVMLHFSASPMKTKLSDLARALSRNGIALASSIEAIDIACATQVALAWRTARKAVEADRTRIALFSDEVGSAFALARDWVALTINGTGCAASTWLQ